MIKWIDRVYLLHYYGLSKSYSAGFFNLQDQNYNVFFFFYLLCHWRQVTLDPGAHTTRERTVVPLSLFVTITSDVTSANNVIPLRTPSHSAHPSLSSLGAIPPARPLRYSYHLRVRDARESARLRDSS